LTERPFPGDRSPVDFSKSVHTSSAASLPALPIIGVEWNDLGDPGRVTAVRDRQVALA
jgi:hypothetical protein